MFSLKTFFLNKTNKLRINIVTFFACSNIACKFIDRYNFIFIKTENTTLKY